MMSPPLRTLEMTEGPPEPAKLAAPDNMDWNITADDPIKTGAKSMPCFSGIRASCATNHGSELMPMGENGNGTFFGVCACKVAPDQRNKTRSRGAESLRTAV